MSLNADGTSLRLVAISGSLRQVSASTNLLQRMADAASPGTSIVLFRSLALIPAFNPDDEEKPAPTVVAELRSALANADGVLFSTPEYAHGVPGVLKNALDWLVGSGELYEKPVAIVQPTTRGEFARASLAETLKIMGARLPEPFIVDPAEVATAVQDVIQRLLEMRNVD